LGKGWEVPQLDVLGILFSMLNVLLGITNALLDALDVPPSPTSSTLQSSLFICHQTPIFNFEDNFFFWWHPP
jgi:hypothetical protein